MWALGSPFAFSDLRVDGDLVPPWMGLRRAGWENVETGGRERVLWCSYVVPDSLCGCVSLSALVPYQISCVLQPAKSPTCARPDQRERCDG
jgi:hypothetical protein